MFDITYMQFYSLWVRFCALLQYAPSHIQYVIIYAFSFLIIPILYIIKAQYLLKINCYQNQTCKLCHFTRPSYSSACIKTTGIDGFVHHKVHLCESSRLLEAQHLWEQLLVCSLVTHLIATLTLMPTNLRRWRPLQVKCQSIVQFLCWRDADERRQPITVV